MMVDHGAFERFVLLLDPVGQKVFRALASGRGIRAAAARAAVSEDYVAQLYGREQFRAAVSWGMDYPERREAALQARRMMDVQSVRDQPAGDDTALKPPARRRGRPAGPAPDASAHRSRNVHAPVTKTDRLPQAGLTGSGDASPLVFEANVSPARLASSGRGAGAVPARKRRITSGPYPGTSSPGSSPVDPAAPEPFQGDHPSAAATDGEGHDDPGVTQEMSPAFDQPLTTSGVFENGQRPNEVQAPRTWTDEDLGRAASAVARLRDQARAEAALGLRSGDLDGMLHDRAFVGAVARTWLVGPQGPDFMIEFGAFLRPVQRRAAESLAQGMKKQDAAGTVGRHRDTLHQWEKDPIFQAYVKQVEMHGRRERDRERRAREETLQANLFALSEDVVDTLRPAVKDDPRLALAALSVLRKRVLGS